MKFFSISLTLVGCLIFLNNNAHAAPVTNEVGNTTLTPIIQLTPEQLAAFEANSAPNEEVVPEGEREKYLKNKKGKGGNDSEEDDGPDFDDEPTTGKDDDEPSAKDNDIDDEPATKNQIA